MDLKIASGQDFEFWSLLVIGRLDIGAGATDHFRRPDRVLGDFASRSRQNVN